MTRKEFYRACLKMGLQLRDVRQWFEREIFREEDWMWKVAYMTSSFTGSNSMDSSCVENLGSTSEQSIAVCLETVSGRFEHLL